VTDAGMPGISDPGSRLVRACLDAGLAVEVVPGPSAVTTALVLSGLATDRFVFEGFLPRKGSTRTERLESMATEPRTTVIFESPRRVGATLRDLAAHCGADRPAALARELTKVHEEVRRGNLSELADQAETQEPRGECVIVLGGATTTREAATDADVDDALTVELATGTSTRDAAAIVSARLGMSRREVYARAVRLNSR
jgi:16S rRNA (cytidine1402-2'-O)-methyltransferase